MCLAPFTASLFLNRCLDAGIFFKVNPDALLATVLQWF
jgi:hypothetical protein